MRPLALWLALLLPVATPAAALAAPPAAKKAQLKEQQTEIKGRIEALRRDLAKSEESHASAADQLKEVESAISATNRRIHQLGESRAAVQAEIDDLDSQIKRLHRQTEAQQGHLARLLYRHYTRGEADALQLMLSGRDPNQAALDYRFLALLSRAKAELIGGLREAAQERKRLADAAQAKNAELAAIEHKQQEERGALVLRQKERQAVLAKVADRIKAQRKEIGSLQRDEKRLAQLIETLARQAAARPKPQAARPSGREPPALRNERTPDPANAGGAFAALKGKLRLPVRGEIANRFGTARADGGATWKGLFIRSAEGTEVRAVAAGRVVFADWLRGFGNLLIVDHDDGFLSVYGNNQSLLREAGAAVKAGEAVATVGNSGGNPESGLYFELRHQGQAFDPMRWVSLR